jgi:hypothetical protein
MYRRRSPISLRLLMLLLLGAVGLALIIIGLGGSTGWLLLALGSFALLVSVPSIYLILAADIEAASRAIDRGRGVALRQDQRDPRSR